MIDEKKRSEQAMGETAGDGPEIAQSADEAAMGRPDEAENVEARSAAEIAMGQPATAAQAAVQEADEAAVGTPATADEMAVRDGDDVAMGEPATVGQRREQAADEAAMGEAPARSEKIVKSDAEWRAELTPDQYRVCREHGTERAFSGAYWNTKTKGMYLCACCGQELFSSETKYDSGTGWPSFWQPVDTGAVAAETDRSFFMTRTEVHCSRCGAHLGHVFPDGPAPTGERYCINSVSLKLAPGEGGDKA